MNPTNTPGSETFLRPESAGEDVVAEDREPVGLESVITTAELSRRPARAPNHVAENQALVGLARKLATSPDEVLQKLAETALELCDAHSAGISLLEPDGKRFYWPAIVGRWAAYVGGGTPRDFGPCGIVLDRDAPQLMSHVERHFTYYAPVTPWVEETLLIPFHVGGKAVGTVWIVSHDRTRRFDGEDLRLATNLSAFAASAYEILMHKKALVDSRRQTEAEMADTKLLRDLSAELIAEQNIEALYGKITDAAVAITRSEFASMQMFCPERGRSGELKLLAFNGFDPQTAKFWEWVQADTGCSCGLALGSGERVIVPNVESSEHLKREQKEAYARAGIRAVQSTPLVSRGGKLTGMISTHWRHPHEPSERDLRMLDILARQAADLIERRQVESALEQAREAAEAANRSKDRFLAVLSHELRTPLSPVVMTVAAMELDADLPPRLREDVAMIRRNIELETRLIDDLLDLSRVTSGKLRLLAQLTRVHPVMRQAVQNCAGETSGKRLEVHLDLRAEHDLVKADPARLQQVFWNLLRNAAKFTPEGGEIFVRSENPRDGQIRLELRDTGIGIPPDVLPKIFDAFEQGDTKTTRHFGGLGLGLAICKAVVDMHGGTIGAASEGAGKGAIFTVELPTTAVQVKELPFGDESPSHDGDAAQSRVLLVEDDPDSARVLARLLRASGYPVKTADSLATALQLAAAEPFDIIVSDLGLPDGTGYDLMNQIRARYAIKGIALSGYGMEDDLRRSKEAGFEEHVVKPVNVAQLESVIRRVVRGEGDSFGRGFP